MIASSGGDIQIVYSGAIPTSSGVTSLHQLPTPPADFTGREEDLNALRFRLTQGGTGAILVLRGIGGVGKTALALQLAEELTSSYPDAQLYLDLKGVDSQPLTPVQAMAHVIRSFRPQARLPKTEAELAGTYRTELRDRRVLLLMDNAASREQIETLIPPKQCLLLVTSRFHFMLPGLFARNLDEMSAEDAQLLLLTIVPRIGEEAVSTLASLCGRLPLALRLAGSALAERPDLSVTDYARRLEEGKERFGEVDAALSVSYKLLNEDRRRLWRLLAVFPGTFTAPAAAAVWELEIDPTNEVFGDLVRSSLVEWEQKEERYRLHDLARSFARSQLKDTELQLGRSRHAKHFVYQFQTAHDWYRQGGESIGQALRLFEAEGHNIRAAYLWASDPGLKDEVAVRIREEYSHVSRLLSVLPQHPPERIWQQERDLDAARKRRDRLREANALHNLGIAYEALGAPRRAIDYFDQEFAIAQEIGDRRKEGQVLGNIGNAYAALGEKRRAIEVYEERLKIARDIDDRLGESIALGNLSSIYAAIDEMALASELQEQALTIAGEIEAAAAIKLSPPVKASSLASIRGISCI